MWVGGGWGGWGGGIVLLSENASSEWEFLFFVDCCFW